MRRIFYMFCWQTLLTASLCLSFQPPQRIRRTAVLERPSTRRITLQSQIHERVYSSALFALSTGSSSSSTTAQSSSSSPPVLTVENLSCTHNGGETYQLKDVSYNLHRGRKVALIGRNGTGKSTFLKILHESYLKGTSSSSSDQLTAYREETNYKYTGKVEIPKTVRVAMVDQEPPMPSDVTVGDAILGITKLTANVSPSRNSNNDVMEVVRNYRFASRQAETDPDAFVRASAAMEKMAGSWDVLTRAEEIASKLKIHHLQDLPLSMLSGGERKRVALCAALVEEPDVLLLDEPSNYLSLAGIEWLSELLTSNSNPKLTVLMVTHDRAFLEEVCDCIVELDRGSLYEHQGSYSSFLQAKEDRLALEDAAVQAANAKLRVELEWMRRQPQARESKSKARIDAFYKLEQATKPRPRDPNLNLVETVGGKSRRIGTKIVSMKNVSLKFGDRVMLDDFSYDFCVGDRICLAGANGVGKTTFTKLITGEVEPDSGFIEIGDTVVLGVYDQLGLKFDPSAESQTVMEFVIDQAQYDNISNTGDTPAEARQLLKQFEFPRSRWNEPISVLSGGERRRLQLLSVLTKKPNFLIADEPSVDLDLDSLSALETFLDQFQGVLLTVSHDRAFADKVTDHLFVFEGNGVVKDFGGTLSEYASCLVELENRKIHQASGDNSAAEIKRQQHKEDSAERNQVRNFVRGAKKEMLNIERALEKLRGKSNDIQAEIDSTSSDEGWSVLAELTDKLNSVNEQIEEKEMRWLELGEKLERIDSEDH
ncbi:ABC transporter ATPase [Nitzschia inconspicua]|uniref:ABC transporter ATPase n=1 Tax=Nitzschia inconspicua TaxID=303405 RepID=A0A9K3KGX1_9STRA|nr:ABC transporter ATPase [Nitzschia inconspicua]